MSSDLHRPNHMQRHFARSSRTKAWAFLSIATLCTALACSNLLDVKSPDAINADSLNNPTIAAQTVNASIGDFDCAYSSYVVASGLMSGEFTEATLTASRWSYDRRDIDPNETALFDQRLPRVRPRHVHADLDRAVHGRSHSRIARRLDRFAGTRPRVPHRGIRVVRRIQLAYCSAKGFARPQLLEVLHSRSQQIFALAASKFDTAVTAAQAAAASALADHDTATAVRDSTILYLALVGRARAELDMGENAQAIADAALIPHGFVYNATYDASADYRTNHVYTENNADQTVSVAPPYENLSDPRVPVTNEHGTAGDEKTPLFTQGKYADGSAPIALASYTEAQLILAEATGGSGAISILNSLRASAGLGALPSS